MLTSVEGIYENGQVSLLEPLPNLTRARVVVTVLPDDLSRPTKPITTIANEHARARFAPEGTSAAIDEDASEISELGQLLLKIRHRAIDQGMPLESIETILDEIVRERRIKMAD